MSPHARNLSAMAGAFAFLDHDGEMARRIREHDWAAHPLGDPATWPAPLTVALDIALASSFPVAIYWGPEHWLLYNDAWAMIAAEHHPDALGQCGCEFWAEAWALIGAQVADVRATRKGFVAYDQPLSSARAGWPQAKRWNYSFAPIRDANGAVMGIFNQGNETTRLVPAERDRSVQVERLRGLFEQAPAAVALLHGPAHLIEFANPACHALVGGRDIVGKTIAQALPELAEQGFVALLDRVFTTGTAFSATGSSVTLDRGGDGPEARILDFVYQPIKNQDGTTNSIFVEVSDVTERARAEAALRESEERLQLALDASLGIGTWDWDVQNDRVSGDARFARLFGVAAARVDRGGPIADFYTYVHPHDRGQVRAAILASITTGVPYAIEFRITRADGGERWLSAQGRCLFDDDRRPTRFSGVSFDVTERKVAEDAARAAADELRAANRAQTFLRDLADQLRELDEPDAVMRETAIALGAHLGLDRVGHYRILGNGLIQFGPSWTSDRLPVLTGTMGVESIGESHAAYVRGETVVIADLHRDRPGSTAAQVAGSSVGVPLMRGGEWVAVFYANTADPHDWAPDEVALIETTAQISWDAVQRAGAAAALRDSEEKFRAIANSIEQMVWSTRADGYHDYYNDRWYEFTGEPLGSIDHDGAGHMLHPDDLERAHALWRQCLATGQPYHIEYRLRHHSGTYRWVLGRAQAVRDEQGTITRWFGTCTDIQDIVDAREILNRSRKELERAVDERTRQLSTTEAQLRQAQKMEAVGQLTGGIAHDFNNMLAVVIGALDLLERRVAQGRTDVERYVTAARDGASRAAALTQRLLAFSRQQPLAPAPVDANCTIDGMIELLVRTIGEEISVETRLPANLRPAMADPSQLENMILNLAVNARDAMPGGGVLTIQTENVALDQVDAEGFAVVPGDYVRITVSDTGAGMSPDVAARAFDPFFTTKGVGKGTGLGLSQVFGFVRQSGGHVAIETALGEGTSVRIYLPVHEGDAPEAGVPGERPALPQAVRGETILVVEDEDRVRAWSVEALRELGYTVIDAHDGPEALRLIAAGVRVDLLFTDIVMPEMTGRELARRAAEHLPGLRTLLTSGYSREDERAGDVLAKPFALDQLAARIRAALDA